MNALTSKCKTVVSVFPPLLLSSRKSPTTPSFKRVMCDRIFVRNSQRIRISGGFRLNHFAYVRMECNAARLRYILPTVVIIYHYYCCYYLRWIRLRELQRPAKNALLGINM